MSALTQIEATAMNLPESQRATLASHLLGSLPAILQSDDEGLAEALHRDAELDENPSMGMTMGEFNKAFNR